MAEEVAIDLTIKTGDAEKNTQSLKSKLKQLKEELAGLEEGSEAFNKVAAEAGKVQDKIGDLNKRVNNLASDTRKLDTFVGVAQGIAGGFATAQGAAALFGAENEDLNKTLLKVQGSVALLNGVQQIANTLNKDSAVMTNLNTAAQAVYATVVGTSTGALKLFRIALASTGIGLIVIAIGELIANWDKLTKAIGFGTEEVKDNTAEIEKNKKALKELQEQQQENIKDAINKEIAALKYLKAVREQAGLDTVEVDAKIRAARLANGAKESDLEIEETNAKSERVVAAMKERATKEAEQEKERLRLIEKARKEEELATEKEKEDAEKLKAQLIKNGQEEEARLLKEKADMIIATEKGKNDELDRLEAQRVATNKANEELILHTARVNAAAKENLQTQGLSFAKNIATLAIKDAKANAIAMKAIAIVELAINTAKSISNAIAGATQSATATGPGAVVATPLFIASQIATVLAAAAQAAAIIAAPIPNVNTGAPPGAPTPTEPTPTVNQAPQVPQAPSSIPIPQQVYVTETDITGTQQRVNVIEGLSKIQ